VPDVVGDAVAEARPSLEEAGFTVRTEVEPSDRPTGQVLRQSPAAETRADRGSIVLLTLSGGIERITVPDVVGSSQDEADRALREVGLRPNIRLVPSDERAGTVLSQRPADDARVDPDTVVRLTVAEARPETVRVPRVRGLPVAEARSRLRDAGLRSSVTRVESTRPVGTVVSQSPRAGRELEKGETVELEVSSGPAQTTVTDVVGLDEISARQQLESAGFRVQVVDQPTSDVTEDGLVVAQDPPGGTQADEGSVVTITVARLS
jgi:serine/threonine-protein kinase